MLAGLAERLGREAARHATSGGAQWMERNERDRGGRAVLDPDLEERLVISRRAILPT